MRAPCVRVVTVLLATFFALEVRRHQLRTRLPGCHQWQLRTGLFGTYLRKKGGSAAAPMGTIKRPCS